MTDQTTSQTKVSINKAAKIVGLGRSTFYRHIEEKGISIENRDTSRPKVDVSELIRVYGDRVKLTKKENPKKSLSETQDTLTEEKVELVTLREKIRHLEELRQTEKTAAAEHIDLLKKMLNSEQAERRQASALLTDQRSEKDKQAERLVAVERENAAMKSAGLFTRLFGFGRKSTS